METTPAEPAVKALALIRHPDGDRILVGESDPDPRHAPFQRLLGGRIRFGETAAAAVERELLEELGLEVRAGPFVAVLEVFFSYRGVPGHDVAIIHKAAFVDPVVYEREEFIGVEDPPHRARWRSISTPPSGVVLAPEGIGPFLASEGGTPRPAAGA